MDTNLTLDSVNNMTVVNNMTDAAAASNSSAVSSPQSITEITRDVFLIFFAGVGGILGLVLLVYIMAIIADRYCCCCPWFHQLGIEQSDLFDQGILARKAGLWGLLREERMAILEYLLKGKPFSKDMIRKDYDVENPPDNDNNNNNTTTSPLDEPKQDKDGDASTKKNTSRDNDSETARDDETSGSGAGVHEVVVHQKEDDKDEKQSFDEEPDVELGHGDLEMTEQANSPPNEPVPTPKVSEKKQQQPESSEDALDDARHDTTCAICLNDYEEGDLVLNGTGCVHMFHENCVLEWLEKHDLCPYCRKEVIRPDEMKAAAIVVLGQERVDQMNLWVSPIVPLPPPTTDAEENAAEETRVSTPSPTEAGGETSTEANNTTSEAAAAESETEAEPSAAPTEADAEEATETAPEPANNSITETTPEVTPKPEPTSEITAEAAAVATDTSPEAIPKQADETSPKETGPPAKGDSEAVEAKTDATEVTQKPLPASEPAATKMEPSAAPTKVASEAEIESKPVVEIAAGAIGELEPDSEAEPVAAIIEVATNATTASSDCPVTSSTS